MSPVVTCDKTGITLKMLKARIVAVLTNRFLEWSILVSPLQAEWLTMMAGLNQGFSLSQEANHFTPVMSYEMKGNREGSAKELEEYLRDNPNVRVADNLRKLIQRLHSPVNNSHAIP